MENRVLKCGIMCNGTRFKKWQIKAIDELVTSGIAEIELFIVDGRDRNRKESFFKKITRKSSFYTFYFNRFMKIPALDDAEPAPELADIKKIYCTPDLRAGAEYFTNHDIEIIKSHNLDFIIRFGFNIIKGEILTAAKYGVWSYHHGDELKYRGGPPAFWEIFNNDNKTGVVLQQLTDKLDGGIILKKGYYKTINHSYKETLNTILLESSGWIAQACKDILYNNKFNGAVSATKAKIYKYPGRWKTSLFISKLIKNKIIFHLKDLFITEQWNIGVADQSITDFMKNGLALHGVKFYHLTGKKCFFADGFGYRENNNIRILFENFNYKAGKAAIYSTTFNTGNNIFSSPVPAIQSEFHLAYPFIYKEENIRYCIPESENGDYRIYHQDNNNEWHAETIELPEKDLIDCSIIKHNGNFWLFATRRSAGSNLKLFIYYSEQLIGPYIPHALNPVKTDIGSARPAGTLFIHDNSLFRPSQDSSVTYGGRIIINKVTELSPMEFAEEVIMTVEPFDEKFNKGIHTLAVADDYLIIDSKRHIFSFEYFKKSIKRKLFNKVNA